MQEYTRSSVNSGTEKVIRKWDVDDATVVVAKIGGFAKNTLSVNDKTLPLKLSLRKKNQASIILRDGRRATLSVTPQLGSVPSIELRVGDQLMVETGKQPITCPSCATAVKPNDRFCQSCGKEMPPAENYLHQKNLKEAARMVWILAALFVVFGIFMFFAQKMQSQTALARIAHFSPGDTIPNPAGGAAYSVAKLRAQLQWAPWGILVVNLVVASIMALLALWARKAPLAALLVATATYAVIIVTNAILDPRTLAQGLLVKIIVIALLIRGIKAALALRQPDA